MSTVRDSTFERGFDLGNTEVTPGHSPVLGRGIEPKARTSMPWKKIVAMSMVLIMIASGFVMLAPLAKPHASAPATETPAHSSLAGVRTVDYKISNMGEVYKKDSRDVDGARGVSGSTPGLSDWWLVRKLNYSDTVIHDSYPYTIAYQTESSTNSYAGGTGTGSNQNPPLPHLPFGHYSFYRFTIDAKNLMQDNLATGPGKDPLYIPVMGDLSDNGGTVQLNWHITYMESADVTAMQAGTSYINTYYGVPSGNAVNFNANPSDGWYIEHSGTMVFDRPAAKKFLNLGLPTSLITQFNTNNTLINDTWDLHYIYDGTADAVYDIMACYDYHVNSGPVQYWLTLDPASTDEVLTVRMWGISWGMEYLMMRYLDVQGLITDFQPSIEDWYFNATIRTDTADIQSRTTAVYHMSTWKDANSLVPSWLIEPQHDDYNGYQGAAGSWVSRFTYYMAWGPITKTTDYRPTRIQWMAGSNTAPGTAVAYWQTPTVWNLKAGETLIVQLPTGPFLGFEIYTGVVSDVFPVKGGGNDVKGAELLNHAVWGEMVLGHGFPSTVYDAQYYNHATKTLTFVGPTTWPQNVNPYVPVPASGTPAGILNWTGSPQIMLDVSSISKYSLAMLETGPTYDTGTQYHLVVTALNYTGVTNTTWTGVVNLAPSTGVALGALSHTFTLSEAGVWTTTITFLAPGSMTITSTDSNLPLDLVDTLTVDAAGNVIPEFASVLMPVLVGAVMIVVFIRRRDKGKED